MSKKIKVLVVDDSAFMRTLLTDIIDAAPDCKVIKTARNGIEALKAASELKPDVITMDIELPEIDGIACVVYIMEEFPLPVIMVTGFSRFLGEQTIKALEYGAIGLVRKPKGPISQNMEHFSNELWAQIRLASLVNVKNLQSVSIPEDKNQTKKPNPETTQKIIAIASSSGGPRALSQIIPRLPEDLSAGVVVAQHIPSDFAASLAMRMDKASFLSVKVAENQEPVRQGNVLLLPPDQECNVKQNSSGEGIINLSYLSKKNRFPFTAGDQLMTSLAPIYGPNATGVVLTGMGNDGTRGCKAIKEHNGCTIAEHKSTCVVYGMPKAVAQAGMADKIVPLHNIADEIIKSVRG
ncbi:MAG: chemotaxis-specific protein-glutamate methyltransferase CheB [Desulfobacteraceae bacterium]|nr:chemotaxis-specific protein-glutamate methyltransferase CheB [Desulfobacteraceae bacterium]